MNHAKNSNASQPTLESITTHLKDYTERCDVLNITLNYVFKVYDDSEQQTTSTSEIASRLLSILTELAFNDNPRKVYSTLSTDKDIVNISKAITRRLDITLPSQTMVCPQDIDSGMSGIYYLYIYSDENTISKLRKIAKS